MGTKQPDGSDVTPVHPDDVDRDSIPTTQYFYSPNGTRYAVTVSNAGALVITAAP